MSTTDTERDERLREARERAALIRSTYQDGDHLRPGALDDLTVLALDDEVTRLDAVVTAVRELREQYFDEDGGIEPEDVWRLHRDLSRALDGDAS